jgi:hypothetical protein
MVKAFFDDSGKSAEEPMFVLAGLAASTEKWAEFSDKWAAKLAEPPRLDYFKMREAWSLRDQFLPFCESQRDRRLSGLIALINQYADFFSYCTIDKADWSEVLRGKIAKTMDSPFYHAYCWVTVAAIVHMDRNGINDTIDIIFDKENETIFREILDWWLRTKEAAATPAWLKDRLGKDPAMDDDLKVLPLQAADLLAWIVSKKGGSGPQHDFAKRWGSEIKIPGTHDRWDKPKIEELFQIFPVDKFPYEDGAARSARLNKLFGPR